MLYLIIIAAFVYFFLIKSDINPVKDMKVSCNMSEDDSCKMYNQRDIQSKCQFLCVQKNKDYIFNGNSLKKGDIQICECIEAPEKFTDFGNNPDILPDKVPNDEAFSDRNFVEKTQEDRFHKLIFG